MCLLMVAQARQGRATRPGCLAKWRERRKEVGRCGNHLQYNEFARPRCQHREQGEADDEANKGAKVAGCKHEHAIPSTY
jgi:hypothetical protein